jgi:TetR/AcrR family transcriptional repressor of nem operon
MEKSPPPKSTRDKILESTIELLWSQSYGSVSVDAICHVAKIQKGSFYHYFPSKVDVVIEAFEKLWNDKRHLFDSVFSPALPPMERLAQYCQLAYEMQLAQANKFGKVLGCPYMTCGSELSTQEERIRCKMDEIFNRSAKYFESLLRDAKAQGLAQVDDLVGTSQEMLAYICGVMYQAKLKNDVEIIQRDLKSGLLRYFKAAQDMPVAPVDQPVKTSSKPAKEKEYG